MEKRDEGLIFGRNAVTEAINAGSCIDKLYVVREMGYNSRVAAAAKQAGIVVVDCERERLDHLCGGKNHQGLAAILASAPYAEVEDILSKARESGRPALIVVCDGISDPHNLGAIIRSAEVAGAHGVILPKRGAAGLSQAVMRTSAGALAHLPVARIPNITALLKSLKEEGIWIFGTDAGGETTLYDADFNRPAAIVIGSEGRGMGRLVSENCDFIVSIPVMGKVTSLNASAATAVLLFEAVRQRGVSV